MTTRYVIERLASAAIPDNVALAQAVGWPDDEAEWRVLHEAAVVLGARRDGQWIGQGALGAYAPHAGTIAKMIVAPSAQRQGVGAAILDALLARADLGSLDTLGLVATPSGQPLYASRGFSVTGEVTVFVGRAGLDRPAEPMPTITDIESAIAFERRFITCSRDAMLRARHREASSSAIYRAPDGAVRGFALATAKGPYAFVGPVIADAEEVARALIRAIFGAQHGAHRCSDRPDGVARLVTRPRPARTSGSSGNGARWKTAMAGV